MIVLTCLVLIFARHLLYPSSPQSFGRLPSWFDSI